MSLNNFISMNRFKKITVLYTLFALLCGNIQLAVAGIMFSATAEHLQLEKPATYSFATHNKNHHSGQNHAGINHTGGIHKAKTHSAVSDTSATGHPTVELLTSDSPIAFNANSAESEPYLTRYSTDHDNCDLASNLPSCGKCFSCTHCSMAVELIIATGPSVFNHLSPITTDLRAGSYYHRFLKPPRFS